MSDKETGNPKEFPKKFKKYDLVIDKGTIFTAIIGVIFIFLGLLFMIYLSGAFK